MSEYPVPIVISSWEMVREAYRSRLLRQGLYDDGVVMENVLINLHDHEHRDRRRLENPLFRRDILFNYERDSFPEVLEARLAPHLKSGKLELMEFGHGVMLELAAINAGIDLDLGDTEMTERLGQLLLTLIDGARIIHFKGDKEAKEREITEVLNQFRDEFFKPSLERRKNLLTQLESGQVTDSEVPRDILRVMVENIEGLDLDEGTIVRETAFFLVTGAATSAVTLTRTFDNIFRRISEHSEEENRLLLDAEFLQRCILETLRLYPISPIGRRWAIGDFKLSDGTEIQDGDLVHIDMESANRDKEIFGSSADDFDPDRSLPEGVPLYGVSFGHGMHACIGKELAVGIDPDPDSSFDDRLFGLVGTVIRELLQLGARPDPDDPPEKDKHSERDTFGRYPVLLTQVRDSEVLGRRVQV